MRKSPAAHSQLSTPFSIFNSQFSIRSPYSILHSQFSIILILFISLLLISCNSSTAPKTGSLSGAVTLVNDTDNPSLDPADFSGVTVAIYRLAVLDTTIVRINQEYPNIGVQISQETEFDHRLQNPVAVATTDPVGSFSLSKLPVGTYNLVAMKQGWGYQYHYQINLSQGENTINSNRVPWSSLPATATSRTKESIILYPEIVMPAVSHQELTFKHGKHYVFPGNSIIIAPAVIETGAVLRIAPGCDLNFVSSISVLASAGAERFTVTSDAFSYTTTAKDSIYCFDKIKLTSVDGYTISHAKISNLQNGIQSQAGIIAYEDMVFADGGTSIVSGLANVTLTHSLIRRFNQIGQNFYNTANITNNIYHDNPYKCILFFEVSATVTNNYFVKNYIGVQPFRGAVLISNNNFDSNFIGVSPCTSDPQIINNNFYSGTYSIELNAYLAQTGTITYCNPYISGNNFFSKSRHLNRQGRNGLYLHDNFYPYGNVLQIQCPNNYWNSMSPIDVIFPTTNYDNLNYTPIRSIPNPNAGIHQ